MNSDAAWAREVARDLLAEPLPRRWAHTQGVARKARELAPLLDGQAELLEAAAWIHDIGYSPEIAVTGFHPLDGARYLRDVADADDVLCRLVAGHSCAIIEAEERGLAETLREEFPPADTRLSRALIYCDMTTTPDGEPVEIAERLAEIRQRYGPSTAVRDRDLFIGEPGGFAGGTSGRGLGGVVARYASADGVPVRGIGR